MHVAIDTALTNELAVPVGHDTHCDCAVLAYVPTPQLVQFTDTTACPGAGLTDPAGHTIHAAADVASGVREYLPKSH